MSVLSTRHESPLSPVDESVVSPIERTEIGTTWTFAVQAVHTISNLISTDSTTSDKVMKHFVYAIIQDMELLKKLPKLTHPENIAKAREDPFYYGFKFLFSLLPSERLKRCVYEGKKVHACKEPNACFFFFLADKTLYSAKSLTVRQFLIELVRHLLTESKSKTGPKLGADLVRRAIPDTLGIIKE